MVVGSEKAMPTGKENIQPVINFAGLSHFELSCVFLTAFLSCCPVYSLILLSFQTVFTSYIVQLKYL